MSKNSVMVRLNAMGVWRSLVQVHTPTDDADSLGKDEFYADVQEVLNRVPRRDRVIVMGDYNARVGKNVEMWKRVFGAHVGDVENDSGEKRPKKACTQSEND